MLNLCRTALGRVQLRRMPWLVLLGALVLTCMGVASIWSSASAALARKQLLFAVVGCVAFFAAALLDYRHLSPLAVPLYALGLLGLAGLPFFGIMVNNSRRWYDLGFFSAQPSEPMKYVLVIVLADYWRFAGRTDRLSGLLIPLCLTLVPMFLIARQPDVGTALVFAPVFIAIALVAGVKLKHMALLALVGVLMVAAAWFAPGVLKDYQKERVISFLYPARDAESSAAYNARQAMAAIAAGGPKGQGWGAGILNRLGRIPERHTDFIFPVIAEEWGFRGTAPIVCVYMIMVCLLAWQASRTWEPFGRLILAGVAALFGFQAFLNIAIALRLAPITGLTLPLISYGGSSLISTYAGLGMAASTYVHENSGFGMGGPAG